MTSRRAAQGKALDPAEISFFSDLQEMLAKRPLTLARPISKICGVDAAYQGDRVFAAACIVDKGDLTERAVFSGRSSLPYVPGLFYLREGPFAVEAVRSLKVRPHLVCFDAHGAAHPRSAGLATICGMALSIPSIGIAKSLLVGEASPAGDTMAVKFRGETVGFATNLGGSERYWSPGYSVSLPSLRSIINARATWCLRSLREADLVARDARSESGSGF